MRFRVAFALAGAFALACSAESAPDAEEDIFPVEWYAGASGGAFLPGSGNSFKSAACASVRAGAYLAESFALELEGMSVPHAECGRSGGAALAGAGVFAVWHVFGYERFDPFLSCGAAGIFSDRHGFADGSHRTACGPVFGAGAFYHLTDALSLRADARAQLCADSPCGMVYSVSAGLQFSFGGRE